MELGYIIAAMLVGGMITVVVGALLILFWPLF